MTDIFNLNSANFISLLHDLVMDVLRCPTLVYVRDIAQVNLACVMVLSLRVRHEQERSLSHIMIQEMPIIITISFKMSYTLILDKYNIKSLSSAKKTISRAKVSIQYKYNFAFQMMFF